MGRGERRAEWVTLKQARTLSHRPRKTWWFHFSLKFSKTTPPPPPAYPLVFSHCVDLLPVASAYSSTLHLNLPTDSEQHMECSFLQVCFLSPNILPPSFPIYKGKKVKSYDFSAVCPSQSSCIWTNGPQRVALFWEAVEYFGHGI